MTTPDRTMPTDAEYDRMTLCQYDRKLVDRGIAWARANDAAGLASAPSVPKEPTHAMVAAGLHAHNATGDGVDDTYACWRAMYDAAPRAQAQAQDQTGGTSRESIRTGADMPTGDSSPDPIAAPSDETINLMVDACVALESLLCPDMADPRSDPKLVNKRLLAWIDSNAMDAAPRAQAQGSTDGVDKIVQPDKGHVRPEATPSDPIAAPAAEPTRHPCGHLIVSDACVVCAAPAPDVDALIAGLDGPHGSGLLMRLGGAQRMLDGNVPISSWVAAGIDNEAAEWIRQAAAALAQMRDENESLRVRLANMGTSGIAVEKINGLLDQGSDIQWERDSAEVERDAYLARAERAEGDVARLTRERDEAAAEATYQLAECRMEHRRAERLAAALRELAVCKDLRDMLSLEYTPQYRAQHGAELAELEAEYQRRKPLAWAAARAALAGEDGK